MQPDVFPMLPPAVAERVSFAGPAGSPVEPGRAKSDSGSLVLYWMHHALRAEENPALDAARIAAGVLGLPLVVLQTIPAHSPYASDRFHTFELQGARDVAARLAAMGVAYYLDVPLRAGDAAVASELLLTLARRAAMVVTEDVPVDPWRMWTASLASALAVLKTPVWAVDTACVVPAVLVGRAYDRAFAYRDATAKLRSQRVGREWPVLPDKAAPLPLPAAVSRLLAGAVSGPKIAGASDADLAAMVAGCEIDHTVGPVAETRGGSVAAMARWEAFVADGLAGYAEDRNDPLRDGVSRMSAYLHCGMISPMLVARQAAAAGSAGAEKFLDELLIWREVAYTWCRYRPDHGTTDSIPTWALQTLRAHEVDRRPALYSWEMLARAETADDLWNAAQRSLLIHGELHNNVRMTWGKALLGWTPHVARALELLIDLNHRYALDGRDPASYGGILWCMGLFDRPFSPEVPVLGSVRPRTTAEHSMRLDVGQYNSRVSRPAFAVARTEGGRSTPRIAVVGAGIAGLLCARTLADHGLSVTLFDKGRGPGGRTSTRMTGGDQFDHGAQFFTARSPLLRRLADSWLHDGIISRWTPQLVDLRPGQPPTPHDASSGDGQHDSAATGFSRFVGRPGMNAVCVHLGSTAARAGVTARYKTEIARAEFSQGQWTLLVAGEDGTTQQVPASFDVLVLATPPENIRKVLGTMPVAAGVLETIAPVRMLPTWATMVAFDRPLSLPFDAAFVRDDAVLSWVALENSKPGRPGVNDRPAAAIGGGPGEGADGGRAGVGERWVLHASHAWSQANVELTPDRAAAEMLAAFSRHAAVALGRQLPTLMAESSLPVPSFVAAHRWRYAAVETPLDAPCVLDAQSLLGVCGDWCGQGPSRVEKAVLSGAALAGQVMGQLAIRTGDQALG